MGDQLRLRRFEPEAEDPALRERIQARVLNRRIYREMIKGEIGEGGLSRRKRKELIQFAESLGIDTYEAHLLLRAVEYECCVGGPAAQAGIIAPPAAGRLLAPEEPTNAAKVIIYLLTSVLIGAMVVRVLMALWP